MNVQHVYYAYWAMLRMRHILSINSVIDAWYFIFYKISLRSRTKT